jgi:hypothetical protein
MKKIKHDADSTEQAIKQVIEKEHLVVDVTK